MVSVNECSDISWLLYSNSTISNYDPTNEEGRPDSSANHRKKPTYQAKKPLSQWKGLGVPNFYLATLEGCSVGKVPSVFFGKEPAVSTAGNVQVQPFRHEPLPFDPKHQRASMVRMKRDVLYLKYMLFVTPLCCVCPLCHNFSKISR